uniref:Uncharacterized protein n=1 Tax=viral metagenome TaxID=1070528 RepID=A0A6C0E926_9ZZZZ
MRSFVLLVIVILIGILLLSNSNTEHFTEEKKETDIPIKPMILNKTTNTITAGSEFVDMPSMIIPAWGYEDDRKEENDLMGFTNNMCSKSCCSQQYPPAFELEHDAAVCSAKQDFVPNIYNCNNSWQNSGCMCMTEKQRDFLSSRGNNA